MMRSQPSEVSARGGGAPAATPRLGLVCITAGPAVRYRTITRTRLQSLAPDSQTAALNDLYRHNLSVLFAAIDYCHARGIALYRLTSGLFPQIDHAAAGPVLEQLINAMAPLGSHAQRNGVRVVLHPDQFVVLNSESMQVVRNSIAIMQQHARVFDLLGLSQSAWSAMTLHGGKAGRAAQLVQTIEHLDHNIRARLVLENDESAYSAAQILEVCRAAKVPMVFDAHHHIVRERLDSYDHDSVHFFTRAARDTWPDPSWQIVHISNGQQSFTDPRHHDLIENFPSAFRNVPWVEVEAKAKEIAIDKLRRQLEN